MIFLFLVCVWPLVSSDRIVTTNTGPIRGISVAGKKVEAFLRIPFAEPPVGELRFAKPVPKSPWEETYDASVLPPACVQADIGELHIEIDKSMGMSEDCLYLNMWVPEGGSALKPIMVWIHGGGYMFGSSSMNLYDGSTLSEYGDVIVASMNYRVGTLGFFAGFIDEAPGSMGMYDQVMAIQWINENAKHFGGDPDNIILFGESAGSFSVSLHLVSPLSRTLFKRAILMSGSAYHPMYSDDNLHTSIGSQLSATRLGCTTDSESLKKDPKKVVDCMRQLPVEKFSETDSYIMKNIGMLIPRVGDDFLPKNPIDLYRNGDFKRDEILIGITRDEGSILLAMMHPQTFGLFGEKVESATFNESSARQWLSVIAKGVENEVFQTYLDRVSRASRYSYLDVLKDVSGDILINCGALFQADLQSQKGVPVYFYVFSFRPVSSTLSEWMGVGHFDEVQYIFGNPMYKEFTQFEKEFSRDIMDMFLAFAKTGNPNTPGGIEWPLYDSKDAKYYQFSRKDALGTRPDNYRCEAWRKMFRAVTDGEDQKS